ncbi:23S rRNA (guanosine(2251)-2'-O)-methyltransferase RlmB [Vibrio genomosp. F10]|uniref:23S rRNA (guanosine-2'-O-)-methyltransferase RlmB n=2 Tax=Vibrio genomosp. F10 TaxID=723171 RepID=A0A1B9R1C0_9VIBR|nr:23S rRNA (guanosine(2251)-2'-O)-methyltransferase RlmB [Vibrio genomosp. F10]OCH77981.1 23S rRNA (guanosine(2251)-2'-O)-methyltransferase RlmB [Vibrio genomosp. F10]OEE37588.1 23S rRNA (guanosine(2251)-2'-O)-methyltransferase RlmB [Vibrio genomosp. F10 str. ZF-129]OEE92371.1 23S rRNA (guanosine(2251)-2'-O)-methyltransferase RlmB [Vibrio genomosp. F10 str. 9ZD137]OEE94683.1 23S rRNA (guanosine(2251)-2'-O)-methyltransferase RlmB [Vibrio genomosp. F10 str. 9ZC157]OEF05249.1 23S rRNA (guanosine
MSNEFIYGIHAVKAVLEKDPARLIEAYVLKGRQDDRVMPLLQELQVCGVSIQQMGRKALDDKAQGANHQGLIAKVKAAKQLNENDLEAILEQHEQPLLLVLDGVTDPHNLGACLRNADAAGVAAVIVPKDRSSPLTATVSKVACGAAETVPLVRVTNLARTMRALQEKGVWFVGTAGEATHNIYQANLSSGSLAIVMGAEGDGMRRLTRETCDDLIKIPMAGSVSSLNVSVASGICLFEAVRQRLA